MNEEIIEIIEEDKEELTIIEDGLTIGTNNYEELENKPQINDVELLGNKTSTELNLQEKMDSLTNTDIEEILNNFV